MNYFDVNQFHRKNALEMVFGFNQWIMISYFKVRIRINNWCIIFKWANGMCYIYTKHNIAKPHYTLYCFSIIILSTCVKTTLDFQEIFLSLPYSKFFMANNGKYPPFVFIKWYYFRCIYIGYDKPHLVAIKS